MYKNKLRKYIIIIYIYSGQVRSSSLSQQCVTPRGHLGTTTRPGVKNTEIRYGLEAKK